MITIILKQRDGNILLSVADNGKGFDTGVIKHSKGLGWKNVLGRVKLLNGKMSVQSEKNKGHPNRNQYTGMMTENEEIRILIADDHQLVVDGIKSMLASEPHYKIVAEANNGQQAWDMINTGAQGQYQLLIADISMPLITGVELCRMVKHKHPEIKVLILSMYNNVSVVKEAIAAEADGYILKNTGKTEFLTALYRISDGGTYFTQDILPIIYNQYQKEKKQEEQLATLSQREKEILVLIVKENTSEEIAQKLFISKKTVDNHRAHILEKDPLPFYNRPGKICH